MQTRCTPDLVKASRPWWLAKMLLLGLLAAGCADGEQHADQVVPDDIARALQTDRAVLECTQGTVGNHSAFQSGWVATSRPDFNDDGRPDWLVRGVHSCLSQDGASDYWLYQETTAGRKLLGSYHRLRALRVLPTMSDGFHDLQIIDTANAPEHIQFNAGTYPESRPTLPAP